MNCPKCKQGKLRQQVSVYVECDADCTNLSKSGIRSKDVVILGVGWWTSGSPAWLYCPECCWSERVPKD